MYIISHHYQTQVWDIHHYARKPNTEWRVILFLQYYGAVSVAPLYTFGRKFTFAQLPMFEEAAELTKSAFMIWDIYASLKLWELYDFKCTVKLHIVSMIACGKKLFLC